MIQILAFVKDLEDPHHRKEQLKALQQREEWNVGEPTTGNKKKWPRDPHHRREQLKDPQQRKEEWYVREPIIRKKKRLKNIIVCLMSHDVRNNGYCKL